LFGADIIVNNREKHRVDFAEGEGFDWESALVIPDARADYAEPRYRAMGFIGRRLYALVFTLRSGRRRCRQRCGYRRKFWNYSKCRGLGGRRRSMRR
jgi:uncharacterized DUF497 family protein